MSKAYFSTSRLWVLRCRRREGCRLPTTAARSDFQAFAVRQASEQHRVGGCQLPPAQSCMGNEQPIERISRPSDLKSGFEPLHSRRIIEEPMRAGDHLRHMATAQTNPPGFEQELQLEQCGRRQVQPFAARSQRSHAIVPLLHPYGAIGVEENHDRRRRPAKRMPSALQSQRHCPEATSLSTVSMIDRPARARFDLRIARMTYLTSRRSMTTAPLRSASSRTSANRSRAIDTVYRFTRCTLYIASGSWFRVPGSGFWFWVLRPAKFRTVVLHPV